MADLAAGFSGGLRAGCERIWARLHGHPFLGELAAGTLPLEKFRFFIEQDLLFLPEFARCMALGAAKSRREEELEFFNRQLDGIVRLEIASNRRLLEQVTGLGAADRGGSAAMAPANLAYTSFLLATAAAGGPAEITAAILPCSWSYVEIARGLGEIAAHPVYSDWVGFYLQDTEADLVADMRATLEEMAAQMGERDRKRLAEIFAMSSRLEGMFWEMAYTLDQWPDLQGHSAGGAGAGVLPRSVRLRTASASISTSQAGSSRAATITAVAAGRMSAKTSPCARATSRQWAGSVRNMRVRMTWSRSVPALDRASAIRSMHSRAWAYGSGGGGPPSGGTGAVPATRTRSPDTTAREKPNSGS